MPVPRLKPLKLRKLPPEEEIPAIHKMNRLAMNRRAVNGLCGFLFEEELQESGANFLRSTACFRKFQSVLQHTIAQGAMKDLEMKKLYYSISEVSKMVDLEQYVLRYWEREFSQLRPQKNRAGNRIYTEKDIEIIKLIKRLTREDRYTISGARQVLEQLFPGLQDEMIAEGAPLLDMANDIAWYTRAGWGIRSPAAHRWARPTGPAAGGGPCRRRSRPGSRTR